MFCDFNRQKLFRDDSKSGPLKKNDKSIFVKIKYNTTFSQINEMEKNKKVLRIGTELQNFNLVKYLYIKSSVT